MAKTVLLADDDRDDVELLRKKLEGAGYTVVTAHDGGRAIQLAKERSPDLIILDVRMPTLDGDLAYTYLKAPSSPVRHIPILFVTGLKSEKDILEDGDEDVFAKPIKFDLLSARIRELIGN